MISCTMGGGSIRVDFRQGRIVSLVYAGRELIAAETPLFTVRLRRPGGEAILLTPEQAGRVTCDPAGALYSGFADAPGIGVQITLSCTEDEAHWRVSLQNGSDLVYEWVDFPGVTLPALKENGGEGEILFPYNEGVLIDDLRQREHSGFRHFEPEYPSSGSYAVFPNMVQSQFLCYLFDGHGLYMGAHDAERGVKGIDFLPAGTEEQGVTMRFRLFCGAERGADYRMDYDIVWRFFDGSWESGAELYRRWFETHLPPRVVKTAQREDLPAWYEDAPLVVAYPVRGKYDTDEMKPNALYPYTNALPLIDRLAEATGSRILALLMHWEGTAPWAPPFVWPPFGDPENFSRFLSELHRRGHLLGVYCSGFGFTMESRLVDDYSCSERYEREGLVRAMCAGPDGRVQISRICTAQRSGYDLCVRSEAAGRILDEAYRPLLTSGVDYVQILDQNHGGGQYFCYAEDHGHPPVPGAWMTTSMQQLLSGWNEIAGQTLLGCESAAAEPFLGNLLFSDNRYELNYHIGRPVPLYAYLYHEYLHNFSGNQVCCGLRGEGDTMLLRLAYSYSAGDCMTLVLTPDGKLLSEWGSRNFDGGPDWEPILRFVANMRRFQREAGVYLSRGRMTVPRPYSCTKGAYATHACNGRMYEAPDAFSTAWEYEGQRVQIFVNHTDHPVSVEMDGKTFVVDALNAVLIALD